MKSEKKNIDLPCMDHPEAGQVIGANRQGLRWGYTTGSCAAAAAQRAAALALGIIFSGQEPIFLQTPKGVRLSLKMEEWETGKNWAVCGVKKDSGDDPDITNGMLLYAKVTVLAHQECPAVEPAEGEMSTMLSASGPQIILAAGKGIGRVTKPGLACAVGEPAINPVPKKMILQELGILCEELDFSGILRVELSAPEGAALAQKTYNPRLGIVGGISILGTSGIVEPMSEQALIDTIKVEMNMRKAEGAEYLLITPGNYGETFIKTYGQLGQIASVKCSNFIGETLDYAEQSGVKGLLLVGHIGKLIKVAAGIMNTHSKYGDARMEILGVHAALAGASQQCVEGLFSCNTTEQAIDLLDQECIRQETLTSVLKKLEFHLKEKTHHQMEIGAVMFSNQYGYLGETAEAKLVMERLHKFNQIESEIRQL